MGKYRYHQYLYGNSENRKKNKCEVFQKGRCCVSKDVCPGTKKCSIFKNDRQNKIIHDVQLRHLQVRKTQLRCVLVARPEDECVYELINDFEENNTISFSIDLQINDDKSSKKLGEICIEDLYLKCGDDVKFKFTKMDHFNFTSLDHRVYSNTSITSFVL